MNLKKLERYLRVNLLGPGPRLTKKVFTGPRSRKGWETLIYVIPNNNATNCSPASKWVNIIFCTSLFLILVLFQDSVSLQWLGYPLYIRGIMFWFQAGEKDFSYFFESCRTVLGPITPPLRRVANLHEGIPLSLRMNVAIPPNPPTSSWP